MKKTVPNNSLLKKMLQNNGVQTAADNQKYRSKTIVMKAESIEPPKCDDYTFKVEKQNIENIIDDYQDRAIRFSPKKIL